MPSTLTVTQAVARLRGMPGVAYAVPDYLAREAGSSVRQFIPNDPGRSGHANGWQAMQWNFLPAEGINVPAAWSNLRLDHHPGGAGVVVAIVDTGVAYRSWNQFRRSPDFTRTHFVDPYDFVAQNRYPLDRVGHGTFVAGEVAESTNNHFGLTGIAYGATIMPVRVLNRNGYGSASNISKGIRYAVRHGAQVINLSIQFPPSVTAAQIPPIISALRYAHKHGVVVVAAAGNESGAEVTYPARAAGVIAVGATTADRCLASYSNYGVGLDLVAPGGGDDTGLGGANCHPLRNLPSIYQMTLTDPGNWNQFGYPNIYYRRLDGDRPRLGRRGAHHRQRDRRRSPQPGSGADPTRAHGPAARWGQAEYHIRLRVDRRRRGHGKGPSGRAVVEPSRQRRQLPGGWLAARHPIEQRWLSSRRMGQMRDTKVEPSGSEVDSQLHGNAFAMPWVPRSAPPDS